MFHCLFCRFDSSFKLAFSITLLKLKLFTKFRISMMGHSERNSFEMGITIWIWWTIPCYTEWWIDTHLEYTYSETVYASICCVILLVLFLTADQHSYKSTVYYLYLKHLFSLLSYGECLKFWSNLEYSMHWLYSNLYNIYMPIIWNANEEEKTSQASQIARFMGPTLGPPGGPMLAPWILLSGVVCLGLPIFIFTC